MERAGFESLAFFGTSNKRQNPFPSREIFDAWVCRAEIDK
jgi:hypothetical protein